MSRGHIGVSQTTRGRLAVLVGAAAVRRVAVKDLRDATLGCIGNS